ncbi:adenylate/guanylate cyclase domain-containing protein [Williamsia maris]|uniref:Adenylate cyclase n=1 Tax=Williamsia maris TaxID=72806 RepID=A0ABT1HDF5_9NOCA|nr:adenylate/guanylate cyclase domain-containing protein [Williamsia maris]MCP2176290.1 adenylate cyclase [Williamsia maris]
MTSDAVVGSRWRGIRGAFEHRPVQLYAVGMVTANVIGAVIVFGLIRFILPLPIDPAAVLSARNFITFGAYLPVAVVIGFALGIGVAAPAFEWLGAGGVPDIRAYQAVLRLPARQVAVNATLWITGLLVFVTVNGIGDGGVNLLVVIALAVGLGGAATCAMGYVVAERILRPITAQVMIRGVPGRYTAPGVTSRLVAMWGLSTAVPLVGAGLIALGRLLEIVIRPGDDIAAAVLALSLISLTVGAGGMLLAARSVADPVTQIIAAMHRVERGSYDTRVPVYDGSEIGRLQVGFNRMAATVGEREHIRTLFGMHVGDAVAARALKEEPTLGGEIREVAVLFIDLVGSTSLAQTHSPEEIVNLLNDFFGTVVETAARHDGFVNKFEGDAALLVYGAPLPHEDPAGAALRTARTLAQAIPFDGRLDAGIGVSFGSCLAGNVGAANRFEYTVIGDPVNAAARLSDLAKDRDSRVVASSDALDAAAVDETQHWSVVDEVTLRGRSEPTSLAIPRS